jgi:hypothetical protein
MPSVSSSNALSTENLAGVNPSINGPFSNAFQATTFQQGINGGIALVAEQLVDIGGVRSAFSNAFQQNAFQHGNSSGVVCATEQLINLDVVPAPFSGAFQTGAFQGGGQAPILQIEQISTVSTVKKAAYESLIRILRGHIVDYESLINVSRNNIAPYEQTGGASLAASFLLVFESIINVRRSATQPYEILGTAVLSAIYNIAVEQLSRIAITSFMSREQISNLSSANLLVTEKLVDTLLNIKSATEQIVNIFNSGVLGKEQISNLSAFGTAAYEQITDMSSSSNLVIEKLLSVKSSRGLGSETVTNTALQSSFPYENIVDVVSARNVQAVEQLNDVKVLLTTYLEQLADVNRTTPLVYEVLGSAILGTIFNLPAETIFNLRISKSIAYETVVDIVSKNISTVENAISTINKSTISFEKIANIAKSSNLSIEKIINLLATNKHSIEGVLNVKGHFVGGLENLSKISISEPFSYSWEGTTQTIASGLVPFTVITSEILWSSYWLAADTDRDAIVMAQGINPYKKLPSNVTLMASIVQSGAQVDLVADSHGNTYPKNIGIPTFIYQPNTYPVPVYTTQRLYQVLVRTIRTSYFMFNDNLDTYPLIVSHLNPSANSYPVGVKAHGPTVGDIVVEIIDEYPSGRVLNLSF